MTSLYVTEIPRQSTANSFPIILLIDIFLSESVVCLFVGIFSDVVVVVVVLLDVPW